MHFRVSNVFHFIDNGVMVFKLLVYKGAQQQFPLKKISPKLKQLSEAMEPPN
jgi:hypothetical protein